MTILSLEIAAVFVLTVFLSVFLNEVPMGFARFSAWAAPLLVFSDDDETIEKAVGDAEFRRKIAFPAFVVSWIVRLASIVALVSLCIHVHNVLY